MNPNSLISDFAGNALSVREILRDEWADTPSMVSFGETDYGTMDVTVELVDLSRFHLQRAGKPDANTASVSDYVSLDDILKRLKKVAPTIADYVTISEYDGEERGIVFSKTWTVQAGITLNQLSETIDSFDAGILNVTDPGAFGEEYLYEGLL